jgi:release factor glutamine methyltransferase
LINEFNHIVSKLGSLYDQQEATAITYVLFEDLLGINKREIFVSDSSRLTKTDHQKLKQAVTELMDHKPVQHVVGFAHFMDLKFKVNQEVLIPRPETEELVHLVVNDYNDQHLHILDIGTGSGCIAISLKKYLPQAEITAVDISAHALETARENAALNHLEVHFMQMNILDEKEWVKLGDQSFDLIVSNPPYVTQADKEKMQRNVLDFDPDLALFVPEDNPLIFYKSIADFSKEYLAAEGKMYFEINESLGIETKLLFKNSGFKVVEVLKDIFGKDRMLRLKAKD